MEGREDKLIGLKENVIIGRLISVAGMDGEMPTDPTNSSGQESVEAVVAPVEAPVVEMPAEV